MVVYRSTCYVSVSELYLEKTSSYIGKVFGLVFGKTVG